jgi:hypothetical protein
MTALVRNLMIVLLGLGAVAMDGDLAAARGAQEPAPAATPAPAPAPPAATPAPAPTPAPTPTAKPEEQLEEFVPSEKLPADDAVAFPVDI